MAGVKRIGWEEARKRVLRSISTLGPEKVVAVLKLCGQDIVAEYRRSIERGRTARAPFKKLSPAYAEAKRRDVGEQPILVRTGSMRDGFTAIVKPQHPRYSLSTTSIGADENGVPNLKKARWHIQGTPRMPARNFAVLPAHFFDRALARNFRTVAKAAR